MKLAGMGMGLSALCAVHCAALPLVSGAACSSAAHNSPWVETSLVGAAALIGYVTLGLSYRRHRRSAPLLVLTAGLLLLFLAHRALPHDLSGAAAALGAVVLIAAQLLNRRWTAACCGGH